MSWTPRREELVEIFVIYRRPSDFPQSYVVRRHVVTATGTTPTAEFVTAPTLAMARMHVPNWASYCLPRKENDEPQIVETWM